VKNEALEKDIPQLREIAGKTWKKEDELKALKSELATLERKIQLELTKSSPQKESEMVTEQHRNTEKEPRGEETTANYIHPPFATTHQRIKL
jgi:hypothetical protein